MSAVEAEKTVAVEQPAMKEKKSKAAPKEKKTKPKTAPQHPPYFQMIQEALLVLNEKSGSSPYAIAKYMEEKHKGVLPANFRKILSVQLKNSVAKGKLIKIKASYKLSEAGKEKKPTKPAAAAKVSKGKTEKKVTKPKKKTVAAKPAKANAKKAKASGKPKQPKSIKSPAAKKAKKAAA